MGLYRGTGGTGDSTTDATITEVTQQATNAAASATAASTSASAASASASSASSSETTATTKASEASTSATNAATSETNAATSETNAATSETNAATSETNASTSETNAATSETNASASETSASTSASTATTKATEAATSATNAAASEVAAELAETNAETAETNAAASAAAAATSETNIGNAETNSAASATAAAASETASAASETAAATSETNAATSETNAATSETNAATSETNAATSATNAATSETNAATSATTASTKASEASTSATNAAASASAAATSATAAQTAETAAETAETNAETAQTAAEAAETAAEAAETAATASETAAAASQASATASANSATASANSASSSATDAQSSEDDAATSEVNAANSASAASSSASAASSSATNAATSATSAAASLASFTGQYVSQATAPSSPADGDLWFDETAVEMKVYDGTAWVKVGSTVNGISNSTEFTATAGQTTFTTTYDVGAVEVYLNGIRLDSSDYTATNGTSIVLDVGAAVGDSVFVLAFGTFTVADHYTKAQSDSLYGSAYVKPASEPISYITNLQTTLDSKLPLAGGTLTGGLTIQETALTGFSAYYGAGQLVLEDDNYSGLTIACDVVGSIYFGKTTDNDVGRIRYDMTYDNMGFTTAGIEQMRIGNGTTRIGSNLNSQTITEAVTGDSTTPRLIVEVQDDSATIGLLRKDTSISTDDTLGSIGFYGNDTTGYAIKPLAAIQAIATQNHNWASNGNGDSPTALRFFTTNNNSMTQTEKVRISDYGDLIVGKTSTASATSTPGTHLSGQYGGSTFTSTYNAPLTLSHTGNDNSGKELMFLYNGSTKIGEIGTHTDRPYLINPTYGGLRIDDYRVNPANTAGATWDNSVDLGAGGTRWKDLYLSGGVYLGGTVAANKLDDYEEGTWTPAFSTSNAVAGTWSVSTATYVKVGKAVHITALFTGTSIGFTSLTGYRQVTGLPFTSSANSPISWCMTSVATGLGGEAYVTANSNHAWIMSPSNTSTGSGIVMSGTYQTND